ASLARHAQAAEGACGLKRLQVARPALLTVAWVLGGTGAAWLLSRTLRGAAPEPDRLAATLLALALLLVPVILLSYDEVVTRLRRMIDARPMTTLVLAGAPILPY